MIYHATAPSNIALIKYMGKISGNRATNPSLSYRLDSLVTYVELEAISGSKDIWTELPDLRFVNYLPMNLKMGWDAGSSNLASSEQERFLNHLSLIRRAYGSEQHFVVRSKNNFPKSCGLASSAASFAALTKTAALAFAQIEKKNLISEKEQSELSRQGSGSSIRSFYGPWCIWDQRGARKVQLPYKDLIHRVVVVDSEEKKIS